MAKHRVRPGDIGSRRANRRLAPKRMSEVRVQLYTDQHELIMDWCKENRTSATNVVKKLLNNFLHMTEAQRINLLTEY